MHVCSHSRHTGLHVQSLLTSVLLPPATQRAKSIGAWRQPASMLVVWAVQYKVKTLSGLRQPRTRVERYPWKSAAHAKHRLQCSHARLHNQQDTVIIKYTALTSSKPASDTAFSSRASSSNRAKLAAALAAATAPTRFIWLPQRSMLRSADACIHAHTYAHIRSLGFKVATARSGCPPSCSCSVNGYAAQKVQAAYEWIRGACSTTRTPQGWAVSRDFCMETQTKPAWATHDLSTYTYTTKHLSATSSCAT